MGNPTNHALTATWTATSTYGGYPISRVQDNALGVGWLSAAFQVTNQNLDAVWGSAVAFDTIEVYLQGIEVQSLPQNYEVYADNDGTFDDPPIASGSFVNATGANIITVAAQNKSNLRIACLDTFGGTNYMGYVSEIRVFTKPLSIDLILGASFVESAGLNGGIANLRDNTWATFVYPYLFFPVLIDFGASYWIDSLMEIVGYSSGGYLAEKLDFLVSADGIEWKTLQKATVPNSGIPYQFDEQSVAKINTRYFGFSCWKTDAGAYAGYPLISQLRMYEASTPTAWAGISGLAAGTGIIIASWTPYEAAATKSQRVYIRSGSAPDVFGKASPYFLCELENDAAALNIESLADKVTALINGTQYYVGIAPVLNDDTELAITACLNQTPNAAVGGGGAWVF
jgi:hypothetical protein